MRLKYTKSRIEDINQTRIVTAAQIRNPKSYFENLIEHNLALIFAVRELSLKLAKEVFSCFKSDKLKCERSSITFAAAKENLL